MNGANVLMVVVVGAALLFLFQMMPREASSRTQTFPQMIEIVDQLQQIRQLQDKILDHQNEFSASQLDLKENQRKVEENQRRLEENQRKFEERQEKFAQQLAQPQNSAIAQKTYANGRAIVDLALLPDLVTHNVYRIEEFINRKTPFCPVRRRGAIEWFSQESEDRWYVPKIFGNKTNGFFIEIGGLDGVIFSNTKTLQDSYGWSGLLIEGQADSAKELIQNRGNCTLSLSQAICNKVGQLKFSGPGNAVAGDIDTIRQDIREKYHQLYNYQVQKVDCSPLWAILRAMKVNHFDLFSLDVEGSELNILESMDWDIVVDLFLVEKQESEEKTNRLHKLMKEHGYRQVRGAAGPNWGYLHKSFVPATTQDYVD